MRSMEVWNDAVNGSLTASSGPRCMLLVVQLVRVGPSQMLAYANQSYVWYLAVPHAVAPAQPTT
jgi:hypothetical protein